MANQQPDATRQGEHAGTSHKGDGAGKPRKPRPDDGHSHVSGGGGERDRHHVHDPDMKR